MKNNNTSFNDTMSFESNRNDEISLLERHDLLTGEPRYIEDEIRNSKFAMIFGALAGVACLVSFILVWILYARDRRAITLIHLICSIVGMLIGFAVAAWGAQAGAQIAKGQPPSNGLTFLAFAGSLIFAVYFAGAALWLTLYRETHLCRITTWTSSTELWNSRMPSSWDLSKGWFRNNRLISWLVVLAIIAAFAFAFCAYATWTVAYNRFKFASYGLYLSCIGLILFGWIMIYWAEEAFEWHNYSNNGLFSLFTTKFLKVLAIIGICVGALAIIVRFLRNRTGFFILGMISLILFVLTLTSTGLLFRNVYQARTSSKANDDCGANLAHIHQDEIAPRWCPSKYLADGQSCRKTDTVLRWEDSGKVASLNPACCRCVKEYYIWPFYILGIYSLLFALCAAIAAATLFYLSDNSDHYGGNKVNDGLDFAFLAVALLIILGFALYFIFRKANVIGNSSASFAAYNDSNVTDANFERVKKSVIADTLGAAPSTTGYFGYDKTINALPTFDTANAGCNDKATCVLRVALLGRNADIISGDLAGAIKGGDNTRLNYFPGCTNPNNSYTSFIGTEEQVRAALKNIQFNIRDLSIGDPKILGYWDQVKKSNLNSNGLLATENPPTNLSEDDAATCSDAPAKKYDFAGFKPTTIKGQLYYIDQTPDAKGNVDYSEKTNIHPNVSVAAFRNGSLLASGNLYENGIYTIPNVLVNPDSSYPITIKFDDTQNIFLDDAIDVVIPSNAGAEVSTGRTRLLTKDGKVCASTDVACISNQVSKYGDVKVGVFNSETGAAISGTDVELRYGASLTGPIVKTKTTDDQGVATFTDVEYGKYNAYVNNSDYVNGYSAITVQTKTNTGIISLTPKDSRSDVTLNFTPTDSAADLDFKLYARNPAGYECEVSPLNKYCAYARHVRDATIGQADLSQNFETIQIKDLAVAKYKTTVEPAPAYSGSCSQLEATKLHSQAADTWNWNTFKVNNPLTKLGLKFSKLFDESKFVGNSQQKLNNLLGLLSDKVPVETAAQAAKPKILLNKGGKIPKEEIIEST
jgi:hypothetical protein